MSRTWGMSGHCLLTLSLELPILAYEESVIIVPCRICGVSAVQKKCTSIGLFHPYEKFCNVLSLLYKRK